MKLILSYQDKIKYEFRKLNLDFSKITDKSVISITTRYCKNLQEVSLQGTQITDRSLRVISNDKVFSELKRLDITQCSEITPEGIDYVLCRLQHLQEISITKNKLKLQMIILVKFRSKVELNIVTDV